MLDIIILAVGKIKEKYLSEAVSEYKKRLSPFSKIKIGEIKAESFGKGDRQKTKEKESEKILNYLAKRNNAKIILLDEQGREFTSQEFALYLEPINQPIIFVIGGALGFTDLLKQKYQKISLSKMTLLHEMARVILLEQIYRAMIILAGKKYHY